MRTRTSLLASLALSAPLAIAACGGGGISGEYGGEGCVYDKLDFRGDGSVYITVFGTEQKGEYEVDGDKVIVGQAGQGLVFNKEGNALEATVGGDTMVCEKL
jgi:hypothetical protein